METTISNPSKYSGKTMAGIILVFLGGLLLVNQLNLFFIPNWLFSWPMWIIAYGLYMGGKYNFRKPIWIWMVVLGTAFLFTENIGNADRVVWPIAIIGVGAWMITKHNKPQEQAETKQSSFKEL
ncbi:LiaF transmembrane domain-containing protein [Mucilaginibacter sp.]|uniref:LiaF transmembrane domain-containing protein n=1 Tax=Mucilaginibacter sp. TaxID=1882438 RepID=UPI003D13BE25